MNGSCFPITADHVSTYATESCSIHSKIRDLEMNIETKTTKTEIKEIWWTILQKELLMLQIRKMSSWSAVLMQSLKLLPSSPSATENWRMIKHKTPDVIASWLCHLFFTINYFSQLSIRLQIMPINKINPLINIYVDTYIFLYINIYRINSNFFNY